jgi:DNA helicase-2/ATP-dependent DNA helicase PcrA
MKLTSEQEQIIEHVSGHAMVHAGPGCGKTTTLALRAKYLIEIGINPKSIAIVTHNKALALDIKKTLNKHLGKKMAKQVVVKTLHSFALLLVRKHHQAKGTVSPSVLKKKRKKQLIKRYRTEYKLNKSELNQAFYHLDLGKNNKVEKLLGKDKAALAKSAYQAYCKFKLKRKKLDFDDMIGQALHLLKNSSGCRRPLQTYRHLMVDELQDINHPQKELLLALSRHMESTVMVGDILQSIYGWRHALPRYWNDLAESLNPKQLALTESFRIPKQALALVNDLGKQIDKDAPVLRSKIEGEKPELIELIDQEAQHRWLAKEIKSLLAKGVDIQQIAILGKTRKELSQTAIALRVRGIAITERYKPTENNRHRDHLWALIQLTQLERKRITKSSKRLNQEEQELARTYMAKLWLGKKTIRHMQDRVAKKPKAILSVKSGRKDYGRINALSNDLRKAAGLPRVESAVQCLIDATKPVLKDFDDHHHQLLLQDLSEIKIRARRCAELKDMNEEWFALPVTDQEQGVQMMTVHGAKGQEWDYVFLINMVHGVYPRYQVSAKKQAEELRVFYVAATRHHKKLYLLQTPIPINLFGETIKNTVTDEITAKKSEARMKSKKPRVFDKPSPFLDPDKQGLVSRETRPKTNKKQRVKNKSLTQ